MKEKRKIAHAVWFPLFFAGLMWLNYLVFQVLHVNMAAIGVKPLSLVGMQGIFFSPFAHGDLSHISSNTVSFLVLGFLLFYFYRLIAFRVFFWNWLFSGALLWLGGRDSVHIGASGLVYGLAFFLFFSGLLRKNKALGAVALVVVFFYGSMVWGMLPQHTNISWEGHLFGAVSGLFLAWYYRKHPLDFQPVPDGTSVSVTWGTQYDYVYEFLADDEDDTDDDEEGEEERAEVNSRP